MSAQPDPEHGVQLELADSRTVAHERARLVGIFLIFFSSGTWVYKHYQIHKIILRAHARTQTHTLTIRSTDLCAVASILLSPLT